MSRDRSGAMYAMMMLSVKDVESASVIEGAEGKGLYDGIPGR